MALYILAARRATCSNPRLSCLQRLHTSTSTSNPWLEGDAAADTTAAAAAAAAAAVAEAAAPCTPSLGIFTAGAAALDALHAASGLPWWAVIPATSVAIKTLLLPVSLKQAKIVRTNMVLWTESFEFLRQREARDKHKAAAAAAAASRDCTALSRSSMFAADMQPTQQQQQQQQQQQIAGAAVGDQPAAQALQQQLQAASSATAALQQLQHWQARLAVYHDLRVKCGVPHPAWFLFNQLLQFPIFVYTAASIRYMARASWPGFSSEGALWFPDLTQQAMQLGQAVDAAVLLPMGLPGLLLPLAVTGIMLTSIRLGFKASGAAARHPSVAGSWLSSFLTYLPPVLYTLTLASTYIKLQLPQAALLHWLGTSSYTLALQLGLRNPRVRTFLGYSGPAVSGAAGGVDPGVAAQAAAVDSADILVVMGAKHAALQRYNEALYCLHRALTLDPQHARAHYSSGQVHALQHQWQQSEEHYRQCAQLAADEASKGQALYCAGVAAHHLGRFQEALDAYDHAAGVPSIQPMVVLGQHVQTQGSSCTEKIEERAAAQGAERAENNGLHQGGPAFAGRFCSGSSCLC
ncbi:hypothetical protein COO60DRAFT_128154 [Scenedesmus sp. NREL 46B-D3]|nr:hypothetical protein COO60DRAFT_128154 [Scenedesmus sp. NREL 46B-D3]